MSKPASATLQVGDQAPLFTLPNQKGICVSLADALLMGPVLLGFHRGTWCPNCRRRFGDLALHSKAYLSLGVSVMAVVAQRSEKVKRYIEDTGLPFDILIDDSRDVMKIYGVWHRVGFDAWNIARPALFLIDTDRTIRYAFVAGSQFEFPEHESILWELQKVAGGKEDCF